VPISRTEFETSELDPSFTLEDFLRSNSDFAYTAEELVVELASKRIGLTVEEVREILVYLENRERVTENRVRDIVYYIYRKPISSRSY